MSLTCIDIMSAKFKDTLIFKSYKVNIVEYGHVTYTCTWPRARPGQLAEADIYIRWALPTFHSIRNQSRFYLTHFTYCTHVHPFNRF